MKRLILPLLALLLFLWFAVGSYWYTNNYCQGISRLSMPPLSITDGNFLATSTDNFSFQRNGHTLKVPTHSESAFRKIGVYLSDNPNKTIDLTGIYNADESNQSGKENLGKARAEAVKNKLVTLGAIADNISTSSLKVNNTRFQENTLYGGVFFTFDTKAVEPLAQTKEDKVALAPAEEIIVKARPLNLYFNSSKYKLEMTPELKIYFDELQTYLKEVNDSKIIITGHTDNKGDRKHNIRISKYRARAVRDFMIENGFSNKRIKIDYKGPDEPLVSNDTEEGRRKNRRVEVRIN